MGSTFVSRDICECFRNRHSPPHRPGNRRQHTGVEKPEVEVGNTQSDRGGRIVAGNGLVGPVQCSQPDLYSERAI